MATQEQMRQDSAANLAAATPAQGELGYNQTDKRVVFGDGSTQGGIHLVQVHDMQNQYAWSGTVSGTDTLTATMTPALLAYTDKLRLCLEIANDNTGGVTLNVNGLGAKTVKKNVDGTLSALEAGDLRAGIIYDFIYDGKDFQVIGGLGTGGAGFDPENVQINSRTETLGSGSQSRVTGASLERSVSREVVTITLVTRELRYDPPGSGGGRP